MGVGDDPLRAYVTNTNATNILSTDLFRLTIERQGHLDGCLVAPVVLRIQSVGRNLPPRLKSQDMKFDGISI